MTEHFPKSTETATAWCRPCNRMTEHCIDAGRVGPCLDPKHPASAPKPGATAGQARPEVWGLVRMQRLTTRARRKRGKSKERRREARINSASDIARTRWSTLCGTCSASTIAPPVRLAIPDTAGVWPKSYAWTKSESW
jgi:hypothetical protein